MALTVSAPGVLGCRSPSLMGDVVTAGGDHPETVCTGCGTPGPADRRFCPTCGTPTSEATVVAGPPSAPPPFSRPSTPPPSVAPPTYQQQPAHDPRQSYQPPPGPPPVYEAAPPPRGRGRVWLAVLVAVVLLGAGATAAFVVLRNDDDPTAAARDRGQEPGTGPTSGPGTETTDEPTSDPTDEPTDEPTDDPTATSVPVPATCWDGTEVDAIEECRPATGAEGRAYVFPAFDFEGEGCEPSPEHLDPTRRDHYSCPYLDRSDRLRFNFSEFDDHDAGITYYTGDAGLSPTVAGDLLRWDSVSGKDYKSALLYRNGTWGVTVYSRDEATRDDAVRTLVETVRPEGELAGIPR